MGQFPERAATSQLYMVEVEFPHGTVVLAHRNIRATSPEQKEFVLREIAKTIAVNPDVTLDPSKVFMVDSVDEISERVKQIAANASTPIATELGLDTANRLLTDPEISRSLAAGKVPG